MFLGINEHVFFLNAFLLKPHPVGQLVKFELVCFVPPVDPCDAFLICAVTGGVGAGRLLRLFEEFFTGILVPLLRLHLLADFLAAEIEPVSVAAAKFTV